MRYERVLLNEWVDHLQAIEDFKNESRRRINDDLHPENIESYDAYWHSEQFEGTAPDASQNLNPSSASRFYLADHSEAAEFYRLAKKVDKTVREAYRQIMLFRSQHQSRYRLWQAILLQLSNINQFLIQEAMPKLRELNQNHGCCCLSLLRGLEQGPFGKILKNLGGWVRSTMDALIYQHSVPIAVVAAEIVQTTSVEGMVVPVGYQPSTPRLFPPATEAGDQSARAEPTSDLEEQQQSQESARRHP